LRAWMVHALVVSGVIKKVNPIGQVGHVEVCWGNGV
jgi:hypothetical protein